MDSNKETSEICEFYKGKHILLTGGTGELGKLVIEKLLRVCKPEMIYLIIRTKYSKEPHHRLKELIESRLFHRLKKEDPFFVDRLRIISGDLAEPELGLSPADAEQLIQKVQIVFHGAATVKFDGALSTATKINVRGTKGILELCKKMKNLESVVHVSTAYSHCPRKEIREEFYETPISPEGLIGLADNINPQILESITPHIIGEWSNTYVFTKAVAEEAVRKNGLGLPIAILRPGIILTTRSEPFPNWADHIYGPIGILTGVYTGVTRVVEFSNEDKGELIPADMTVNCLLTIGHETAKLSKQEISIYNLTSHPKNTVTWGELFRFTQERAIEIPYSHTYGYYPSIITVKNSFIYSFLAFFLQILPGVIIDTGLIFFHKKPRFLKMYNKIHNATDLLEYFSKNTWIFSSDNTTDLWKSLNNEDKKLFDFDMESLDYKPFLKGIIDGISLYILKDENEDIAYRRRRYFIIHIFDHIARLILLSGVLWCIWRIFTRLLNNML